MTDVHMLGLLSLVYKKIIQIFVYRVLRKHTKKNLIKVKMKPTDMYRASSTCMGNYAGTNLPGQQFNFQKQNLGLRYKVSNGFLQRVYSFVKTTTNKQTDPLWETRGPTSSKLSVHFRAVLPESPEIHSDEKKKASSKLHGPRKHGAMFIHFSSV